MIQHEEFDIYDENRIKTGRKAPKRTKLSGTDCRVVVHVCIFNSKREMLIQKRQADGRSWSNKWDVSVGGSVQAGETPAEAMTREAKEELGLDLDFSKDRPYLTINFDNGYDDYFLLKKDIDLSKVKFTDGEVQEVRWASESEILKLIEEDAFVKYYPAFISLMFQMLHLRGAFNE